MTRQFKPKQDLLVFLDSNPLADHADPSLAAALLHMMRRMSTLSIPSEKTAIRLGSVSTPMTITLQDVGIELADWLQGASDDLLNYLNLHGRQTPGDGQILQIGSLLLRHTAASGEPVKPLADTTTLHLEIVRNADRRARSRILRRWSRNPMLAPVLDTDIDKREHGSAGNGRDAPTIGAG